MRSLQGANPVPGIPLRLSHELLFQLGTELGPWRLEALLWAACSSARLLQLILLEGLGLGRFAELADRPFQSLAISAR